MMKNIAIWVIVCIGLIIISCISTPIVPAKPPNNKQNETVEKTPTKENNNNPTDAVSVLDQDNFIFDPAKANTSLPNDINNIVEEVMLYGRGGGDGDNDPCKGITSPTIVSEWFEVEQLENAWVFICGWKKDNNVSITLSKPDGSKSSDEDKSLGLIGDESLYKSVYWNFLPTAFDPAGKYKVHFSNGEQSLDFEFNVSRITKSGATLLYSNKEIQIYNFSPYEKIRLFKYSTSLMELAFESWKAFSADGEGKLSIKLSELAFERDNYAVIGENTGEFHLTEGFGGSILKANTPSLKDTPLCSGAPISKVAVGSTARVTFTNGTPTRIRKQPTTSSDIVARLPEGTRFLIAGEHKCSDGYTWWRVELPNGSRGWMAEGKGSTYFLEPMNYLQQTCSVPVSRLSLGDKARVARVDGTKTRIRSKPGFSQDVRGSISEGTALTILNGPKCIDGNNWWYVRTNNGIEGWMTEAQNGVYLLEPAP